MDVQILLDKLTRAVSFLYKEDGTVPGITTTYLKDGSFYASVVRYPANVSKKVMCSAKSSSLEEALKDLAQKLLKLYATPPNPVDELNKLVSTSSLSKPVFHENSEF